MNNNVIKEKYNNSVVAIESFGNNEKIYAPKFINEDDLIHYLYMMNDCELTLTDDGLIFLKDYYGLGKVADIILAAIKDGLDFKYNKKEDILKWLERKGDIDPSSIILEN